MVFIVLGGICLGCCCLCCICVAGEQWCRECFGGPDPEIERIRREMEERQPQISTRLGGWAPAKSTPVHERPAPKTLMQERMDRLEKTVERLEGEQHHTQESVVVVQLVDEQLVNLEVPPAEITVATFPKLVADLAFYSGLPGVQGLLVKSNSGHYVQVFDMERIPKGDIKVRPVESGDKHFLRVYASNQLEE